MSGKSDEEKAIMLVSYDDDALRFYLEIVTEGSSLSAEGKC